ncbi:MAG: tRNA (adenosine(37)-N6)-threonylcarbamoyltransferase complex ATPase subunit type 1 TsaE, partial [Firmicutes bacterium]|nr:tRNA (adenosine(37)-N6)-threonylcarbamoyltransferase complex ATPase subunit type 1 TsaE [Bacillota bacterium]
MEYITGSPEETEAVGAALGQVLTPGSVVAYRGDLGAGKTAFPGVLAGGLGCTDTLTSPTYTILNYFLSGRSPLFQFDMYRLRSS